MNTYLIQVRGVVDVNELNPMSPYQLTALHTDSTTTQFAICTDQAGMIGLLRHLHNIGVTLISITAQMERKES